MIKVNVSKDFDQQDSSTMMIICPECGQKLTDIRDANGLVRVRIKCRRCRTYINIDILGKCK